MEQKKQLDYLNHLNIGGPEDHEAIELVFLNGIRKPEIICSCGCRHPTGGIDQEFVLWGSSIKQSEVNSSFTGENLPPHLWKHLK